jgi:hypothetical protein
VQGETLVDPKTQGSPFEDLAEAAGWMAGRLVSPLVAAATLLRGARLFHAEGDVFTGLSRPGDADPLLRPIAERLSGRVLLRVSAAVWRGVELPDLLGLSLRFHGRGQAVPAPPLAQDLLLVSAGSLLELPLAFLATDPHDYTANVYNGLATFDVAGVGRGFLRARFARRADARGTRAGRMRRAVARGEAAVLVEFRREDDEDWQMLTRIDRFRPSDVDQRTLALSPEHDGAGIRPIGFLQSVRRAAYGAGQYVRRAAPLGERTL